MRKFSTLTFDYYFRVSDMLVFGVLHIHWRKILVQVEVLQASQIKHGRVHALGMIISHLIGLSRLIGLISRLGLGPVD